MEPDAIDNLEAEDMSAQEFVTKVTDSDRRRTSLSPILCVTSFGDKLLSEGNQLLVVLGDPGVGKTTFVWQFAQRSFEHLKVAEHFSPQLMPWWPIVIDLKLYSLGQIEGLLITYLREQCSVDERVIARWASASEPSASIPRFLVLCDGFDELKAGSARDLKLRDFVSHICGGTAWHPSVLKVVVTSRESAFSSREQEDDIFGRHLRCIILPFSSEKVG